MPHFPAPPKGDRPERRAWGSGRLYWDKSKRRWVAAITVDGRPYKRLRRTKPEGREALKELTKLHETGRLVTRSVTLRQWVEEWLADSVLPAKAKRTFQAYAGKLARHVLPVHGSKRIADIKASQIRVLLRELLRSGKSVKDPETGEWRQAPLSPSTVAEIHAILHRVFDAALKDDLVAINIMDAVARPRTVDFEAAPLSPEQARATLAVMRGHIHEHLWQVILWTGCRFGEAAGLRREYVNEQAFAARLWWNLAEVPVQLREPDGPWWEFKELKNRRRRSVPLTLPAVAALRNQAAMVERMREAAGERWQEMDLVFPDAQGRPLREKTVLKRWKAMLRKAGLPVCRIHDLRHTTAELALENEAELIDVARLLGHRDATITDRIYGGKLPKSTRRAAERVARALEPEPAEVLAEDA